MTKEEQRKAIAETCGWERGVNQVSDEVFILGDLCRFVHRLPNYLNDLNAMHEAKKTLKGQQTVDYVYALRLIIERADDLRTVHWFAVVCATAEQEAEAFLRTINKWKD